MIGHNFEILSITGKGSPYYGDDGWIIRVSVRVDNVYWRKLKSKNQLGQLYGVDISNLVYSFNKLIPASNPLVEGHKKRASKGYKYLELAYRLGCPENASKLGFKVIAGNCSYADRVTFYVKGVRPILKAVAV